MKFTPTPLEGVMLIEPKVFEDDRGFFYEDFNQEVFARNGIRAVFVQDNHSRSRRGVLRGLHYQVPPKAQAKLVRVVRGEAFDAVVDLRENSKTYGKHFSTVLSEDNRLMLYIPEGFAHGFLSLRDGTEFLYKVTAPYSPEHERGLLWRDKRLGIPWPKLDAEYIVSARDAGHPSFQEAS